VFHAALLPPPQGGFSGCVADLRGGQLAILRWTDSRGLLLTCNTVRLCANNEHLR
jgi:hypothetical protein